MTMDKRNSRNTPPPQSISDKAAQERGQLLNMEMQAQSQFYAVRAQLFNSLVGSSSDAVNRPGLAKLFELADIAAIIDYSARVEEAEKLMNMLGEKMRMPALYKMLHPDREGPSKFDKLVNDARAAEEKLEEQGR